MEGGAGDQIRYSLRDDPTRCCAAIRRVLEPEVPHRFTRFGSRSEHAARLVARNFDLVIVDEAHHLRDRNSQSYKLVDALNKRFLLLLSATPVQNDLIELYNLLTLLKPGIFKTLKEFRAAHMTPGKPRQPANPERLRELMRAAMVRNTRAVVALKLPRRHAVTIRVDGQAASEAYEELAAAARRLAAEAERAGPARAASPARRRGFISCRGNRCRGALAAAVLMSRVGTRWRNAGPRPATAARRGRCSTCCGGTRMRRNWSSSITARRSIISPTC